MAITVKFIGICTHFSKEMWDRADGEWPLNDTPYRVVLANARAGRHVGANEVPPHESFLVVRNPMLPKPDIPPAVLMPIDDRSVWRVTGAYLRLDAGGSSLTIDWTRLPRLRSKVREMRANADFLCSIDSSLFDAYFDFSAGCISAICTGKATAMQLIIAAPKDNPQLCVESFAGEKYAIPLLPDAQIEIRHQPVDPHEMNGGSHFALHYLTATAIPTNVNFKHTEECSPPTDDTPPVGLGPDCSNAGYP